MLDESLAISRELGKRPLVKLVQTHKLKIQSVASMDVKTPIDRVSAPVTTDQPDLRPHAEPPTAP